MRDTAARPWSLRADGVTVQVRVTPKSSNDAVEGLEGTPQGPALKVRVRAVPEKGAANAAVVVAVARWLGVPKSTVSLASGGTSRLKCLAIAGNGAMLCAELERRLAEDG
jgi:uncharacterized protein YggU (UPF0235/DUF167 family)